MSVKRILVSIAGSSALVAAALTAGAQSVGAQTAPIPFVNCDNPKILSNGLRYCDPVESTTTPATSTIVSAAPAFNEVSAPITAPVTDSGVSAPVYVVNATQSSMYNGYAQFAVNQDSYLNLVAQQIGVSRASLNYAFQQAEATAAQAGVALTQDQLLNLVAGYLGVDRYSLNVALQQAAYAEVAALQQSGLLSAAQASVYDSYISAGIYGVGLGFGIPGLSAAAI